MNPLALFALLGLGLGSMDATTGRLERAASSDIGSVLQGSDRHIDVQVLPDAFGAFRGDLSRATITASRFEVPGMPLFTEPERSTMARIKRLEISLTDFVLAGLHVQELVAQIPDCRYDLGLVLRERQFRLSKSGIGWGTVKLSEGDLADYILKKYKEVEAVTVRAFNDVLWIEGTGTFLVAKTDFAVIGRLAPGDGHRLILEDAKVYFNWQRAEPGLVKVVLKALNPVIDLSGELGLLDAVKVQEITLRDGVILASGPAKIPVRPTDNQR